MKKFYHGCIACIEVIYRVTGFSGGPGEGSERFSEVFLGDYRGTKRIDRIFGGCVAFRGGAYPYHFRLSLHNPYITPLLPLLFGSSDP